MRKLFYKILLFSLLPFTIYLINSVVFSPFTFTHRIWDGLAKAQQSITPFYPNYIMEMEEIGDLGFRTNRAIIKHVYWKTDSYGFRNDTIIKNPDILILGDSFVAGGALSQEQTITNILSKLNPTIKIYNMAPSNFSVFLSFLNAKLIEKPKVVIQFGIERFLNTKTDSIHIKINTRKIMFSKLEEAIDRIFKSADRLAFSSFFRNRTGIGIPSPIDSKMLFFEGNKSIYKDAEKLKVATESAITINKKCQSLGITFLFIPMPNKESLYWEMVPYTSQPNLLYRLDSALKKNNILTLNALDVLTKAKSDTTLLYHYDDSHWNANGVKVIAENVKCMIDSLLFIP